ncbi:hypothetical protein CC79DRAFT_1315943 [Sarocladium strictum]
MASPFLTLLGGATFAQAVDVFFHTEAGCSTDTGVLGCTDLPNDTCCTFTNPAGDFFNSVQYTNLPTDANVDVDAIISDGNDCNGDQWFPRDVYGVKRSEVEDCVEKREADTLVLRDGTRFNIAGLEKKDLNELMGFAKKGDAAADAPAKFEAFKA